MSTPQTMDAVVSVGYSFFVQTGVGADVIDAGTLLTFPRVPFLRRWPHGQSKQTVDVGEEKNVQNDVQNQDLDKERHDLTQPPLPAVY